jgi:hypothetical protein
MPVMSAPLEFVAPFDKLSKKTKTVLNNERDYLGWYGVVTFKQMEDFAFSKVFFKVPNFGPIMREQILQILRDTKDSQTL